MEGENVKSGWRQGFGLFNRGVDPTMSGKAIPIHEAPPACCLDLWLERHELPADVPPTAQSEPKTKQEHLAAARNQQYNALAPPVVNPNTIAPTPAWPPRRLVVADEEGHTKQITLSQLMAAAANEYDIPEDDVVIAKHDYSKNTWVVLTPHLKATSKKGKKQRGGQVGGLRQVRNPPFSLKDGDVLGVLSKADDMTPSEDYGLRNPSPNNALFDTKADERARRRKAEEKAEMKAKGRANKGVNGGGKKNQGSKEIQLALGGMSFTFDESESESSDGE
mmetsp:Transcript_56101/g.154607  ORF Transcript_56101/g.154607 Transcript_56101/m.154607 type:complete len:278 (+) Transcript_56101:121-954(+)